MNFDSVVSRTSFRPISTLVLPTHVIRWLPGLLLSILILSAPVAYAQTADDQSVAAQQDTPVLITLTGSDPEDDALTFVIEAGPFDGTLSNHLDGDALVTYTPDPGFNGSDSFTFTVSDGVLASAEATVSITVNGRPTANDQGVSTDEDFPVPITLSGSDPETDPLTFEIVTGPSVGTLSGELDGDELVTYTPALNSNDSDSFTFRVSDGQLTSAEATVSITVNAVNDAPEVVISQPSSGAEFDFGTLVQFAASATDVDDNDVALTNGIDWSSDLDGVLGKGGTASSSVLRVGTHVITAETSDGDLTGSATISVVINNTAPTANGQSVSTGEDTPLPIVLTGSDPEGSPLTFSIAMAPANGSLSGTPPLVTYTPDADFNGLDSFTFTVSDGDLTSLPATVSITVDAGNDIPVANAQSVTTAEETPLPIVLTGSDPEGSALTFAIATQPANGTLAGAAPNVTYTPDADFNGPDSFTFTVNDGELNSAPAMVDIAVTPVNDPPVANNDTPPAIDEGGSINGTFNVLDNDTDAENDALTAVLVAGPSNALNTFQFNADGTFTYEHDGSDTVTDSFSYQASDGELSNVATVTISINSVNDAPVAVNDGPFSVDEGASFDSGVISVLDNDTDSEDDPLTATVVTPPANAAAFTLNTDGTFTYTHDGSETLADSFTYRADDGSPSNVATVTFTIIPVNDAPTFVGVLPPGLSTPEDTTLTIPVSALEIEDPDSDPSNFVLTLDPVLPPDANYILAGTASITPAENFNGKTIAPHSSSRSPLPPRTICRYWSCQSDRKRRSRVRYSS
jgi:VCBS repeat-containing protein